MTDTVDLLNPFAKIKPHTPPQKVQNLFHPQLAFWNVDTQFDFMRKGGAPNEYVGKLVVEGAQAIEPQLQRLTNLAEKYNVQVINTADWHRADSAELSATPDFATTYPEHCMQFTKGAEFVPATKPINPHYVNWDENATAFVGDVLQTQRNIVMLKDKFDIFAGNKYANTVTQAVLDQPTGKKTVVVYGVATNVCVDYAVVGLRERGYNVLVPEDAIKHLPHLETHPTMNLAAVVNKWKEAGVQMTTVAGIERLLAA